MPMQGVRKISNLRDETIVRYMQKTRKNTSVALARARLSCVQRLISRKAGIFLRRDQNSFLDMQE